MKLSRRREWYAKRELLCLKIFLGSPYSDFFKSEVSCCRPQICISWWGASHLSSVTVPVPAVAVGTVIDCSATVPRGLVLLSLGSLQPASRFHPPNSSVRLCDTLCNRTLVSAFKSYVYSTGISLLNLVLSVKVIWHCTYCESQC